MDATTFTTEFFQNQFNFYGSDRRYFWHYLLNNSIVGLGQLWKNVFQVLCHRNQSELRGSDTNTKMNDYRRNKSLSIDLFSEKNSPPRFVAAVGKQYFQWPCWKKSSTTKSDIYDVNLKYCIWLRRDVSQGKVYLLPKSTGSTWGTKRTCQRPIWTPKPGIYIASTRDEYAIAPLSGQEVSVQQLIRSISLDTCTLMHC